MADLYTIRRRSGDTADGDPIVLRETQTTRLVFIPRLVNNAAHPERPVNGAFVYQKKRRDDSWEDHNELRLSNLKADEWVKLDLPADEIHTLMQNVAELYRHYKKEGLPTRQVHFLRLDAGRGEIADLGAIDIPRLLEMGRKAGLHVFGDVVHWAANEENAILALEQLQALEPDTLQRMNSLVGLSALKEALATWEANQSNADEEFWQRTLQQHAFVLSQVFAFPTVVIEEKAYFGGKRVDNKGGQVADFLCANPVTKNAIIIEIKTPATDLLGGKYRGVYSISSELSGAVIQTLKYRYNLMTNFLNLRRDHEEDFEVFNPQCLIIAGHTKQLRHGPRRLEAFEMFRSGLRDVLVITFDELFDKTRQLIAALEGVILVPPE
jgi:hypothetical protein